jgi:glycosyltransferase involved in cell wall biosynthesis
MEPKISIIVPVYNTEKYVAETLELLAGQTYNNIEFILVDNNSRDRSLDICRSFAEKDPRFKVFSETTQGPSAARNRGLDEASGDYICFCDSDDLPDREMYGTLLESMVSSGADMAMCEIHAEHRDWIIGFPYEDKTLLDRQGILADLIPKMIGNDTDWSKEDAIWGSVVRCIYRRDIIEKNKVRFPLDISYAEDLIFTLSYLKHAQSVYMCKKVLYHYRRNEESLMWNLGVYEKGIFEKEKKKVMYLKALLEDIGNYDLARKRALVSYKHYVIGALKNASMYEGDSWLSNVYKEIKAIVDDESVHEAFASFDCIGTKQKLRYRWIYEGRAALLTLGYRIKFFT